jgi:hypothetical protein
MAGDLVVPVGVFSISMDVVNGQDQIASVRPGMAALRHVVRIYNFSGHPAAARVRATLPNGNNSPLAFDDPVLGPSAWEKKTSVKIPECLARTLECGLRRNGGPARAEPIQCDRIWATVEGYPENELRKNLPFSIAVDVA